MQGSSYVAEVFGYMENLQRLSPIRTSEARQQEYGASKGVGENPLNGKGAPLARYGEGEEIV